MRHPEKQYMNSVNLNIHTEFPYLVLHVENDTAHPLNPGFGVMHWHEDLQFIYVEEGNACVRTLEEEEGLCAGEGIFINKNEVHRVERKGSCRYKSFLFPDDFVSFYVGSPAEKLTREITENEEISLVVLRGETDWSRQALCILKQLARLEEDPDEFYSYEVLSRLSALWLILLKNVKRGTPGRDHVTSLRVKRFLEYIERNYAEEITLEDLAKSGNVSKSECLRCFKTTLRTTPYRYLMDFRLSQASRLLKDTDLPIGQIAVMTGFHQQSYFGKCFREKMKCTPREYREGRFSLDTAIL